MTILIVLGHSANTWPCQRPGTWVILVDDLLAPLPKGELTFSQGEQQTAPHQPRCHPGADMLPPPSCTPQQWPPCSPHCAHAHLLLHQTLSCSPMCQKFLFTLNMPFPLPLVSFPTHSVFVKAEVLMKQYWQHNLLCWFTFSFLFQVDVSCCLVTQSCLTLCNPMDYSPPGSSVHGLLQARIMEFPSPRRKASLTWNRTQATTVLQPKSTESYPLDHQGESMYFIGDSILVKVALFCSLQSSHSTPFYKCASIYLINPLLGDGK